MSLPREEILKELELLPVWRPRNLAPETQLVEVEPTVEATTTATTVEVHAEPISIVNEAPAQETVAPPSFRKAEIADMDWEALEAAVKACEACSLAQTRIQTVFGVGDRNAEWLFVGEAPGAEEDRRGEPFVGQAGKLLDNMLAAISLKRGDNVYIANVLKCRPPENRDPHGEEVVTCDPFLKRQVELIKPRLIVAMGRFAAQSLLNTDSSIGALRGKQHDYNGVPVIVTYHPAYLLRNLTDKAKAWEDLCYARRTMRDLQTQSANLST
jgi:uracil-DNA glycosylase family 4